MMLSANCSLCARFPWNKTQYNLISDGLCKTFYISEVCHSGKQLFLSFVANLIPVKFEIDPVLSLKALGRPPAHWLFWVFLLPVVEQIVSFFYSCSLCSFHSWLNFRLWSLSFSSEWGCYWTLCSLVHNSQVLLSPLLYSQRILPMYSPEGQF